MNTIIWSCSNIFSFKLCNYSTKDIYKNRVNNDRTRKSIVWKFKIKTYILNLPAPFSVGFQFFFLSFFTLSILIHTLVLLRNMICPKIQVQLERLPSVLSRFFAEKTHADFAIWFVINKIARENALQFKFLEKNHLLNSFYLKRKMCTTWSSNGI